MLENAIKAYIVKRSKTALYRLTPVCLDYLWYNLWRLCVNKNFKKYFIKGGIFQSLLAVENLETHLAKKQCHLP